MDRVEPIRANFAADAYAGTAGYYVKYRPPYPEKLLRGLLDRAAVKGGGRLLDLACGPGRVAFALAPSFSEIWGIDLEPEMIETARKEAARRRLGEIRWMVGRVESLEAPPSSFELVTMGEAFHRLDRQVVAKNIFRWLKPGGHVASLGSLSILSGTGPWQRIVVAAVNRWTGRPPRDADASPPRSYGGGPDDDERVLRGQGFADVASHFLVEAHDWTIEAIIGYLYSTSVCSRNLLGGRVDAFEADLKAALLSSDPGGIYRENIRWGFTIGRKPAGRDAK
jgi:SAM-dependent methyltransferase